MGNLHVAAIPFWVCDSVWRSGQTIGALLDFNKVQSLLSTREIAILAKLQTHDYQVKLFGAPLGVYGFDFYHYWKDSVPAGLQGAVDKACSYAAMGDIEEELRVRLFDNYECRTSDNTTITEVPRFGIAVRIAPNTFFGERHAANSKALSREVCNRLYKYEGIGKLISSPIGAHYVETLSR